MVGSRRRDPDSCLPPDDLRRRMENRSGPRSAYGSVDDQGFGTEMATEIIDQAMQTYGAMGMTKECRYS